MCAAAAAAAAAGAAAAGCHLATIFPVNLRCANGALTLATLGVRVQSGMKRSMSIYYTVTGHESGPILCLSGIICRLVLVHPVLCRDELGDDDSKADSKSLRPVFGHPFFNRRT